MPNGSRVRANNVYGTTTDNPLLIGATSFTSLGLNLLPAIVSPTQHAVIVLDPKRVFGDPEIVVVTAHTAMGTTATITRGTYGTVAREHPQGTAWAHVPVGPDDYIPIVTSGTRPGDPFVGEQIFETDTDKYVARNAANNAWVDAVPLGAWTSWTPTITNLTGGTVSSVYHKVGRLVNFRFKYTLAGAGMGTSPQFTLPFTAHADFQINMPIGSAVLLDSGVLVYVGFPIMISTTTVAIVTINTSGATASTLSTTATVPFTWGAGDIVMVVGSYESTT